MRNVVIVLTVLLVTLLSLPIGINDMVRAQDSAMTPGEICDEATPAPDPATREYDAPEDVLEPGVDYRAIFCTEVGPVYVDLFEDYTPITVNSFVFLAQNSYYNNITFHRVLADFMAQGGDPTATGGGGPGYQFRDEFVGFLHFDEPGLLAMANANRPESGIFGTNGSQFFITTAIPDYLSYRHTIFGDVLEGLDVVYNIPLRDPDTATGPGPALNTVVIITDPAMVETTYEPPQLASQEEVLDAIAAIPELILALDEASTGLLSDGALIDAAGADGDTLTALLEDNAYQYSARARHTNAECDFQNIAFESISYTLNNFATEVDANTVMASNDIQLLVAPGSGFTEQESEVLPNMLYVENTEACGIPAVRARTYWQRGRFISVGEVVLPAEQAVEAELWLDQVVARQLYENLLSDILRREIRGVE